MRGFGSSDNTKRPSGSDNTNRPPGSDNTNRPHRRREEFGQRREITILLCAVFLSPLPKTLLPLNGGMATLEINPLSFQAMGR